MLVKNITEHLDLSKARRVGNEATRERGFSGVDGESLWTGSAALGRSAPVADQVVAGRRLEQTVASGKR